MTTATLNDPCRRNRSTEIHIIGFFPCTDPNDTRGIPVDNCDGIERIPIMKLALEEINERCDLLPGYRLVVDYANSAVSYASHYVIRASIYIYIYIYSLNDVNLARVSACMVMLIGTKNISAIAPQMHLYYHHFAIHARSGQTCLGNVPLDILI